jgi:hypothetical protein
MLSQVNWFQFMKYFESLPAYYINKLLKDNFNF